MRQLEKEKFNSANILKLESKVGETEKKIKLMIDLAEQQDKVLRLEGHLIFTRNNFIKLKSEVISYFKTHEVLTIADFKEMAGTSRKYAMPLLEYFDQEKITYRVPDGRKLIK